MSAELFTLAQEHFRAFLREFAEYGIELNETIEMRPGNGMLCYYDMNDGHIYMSIPDANEPVGKLHWLFLRSLLKCESQAELMQFFHIFIPYVIAHELAHHFRHKAGLFSDNRWHEEQVANQLAVAVTKHRLTPEQKAFARQMLPRAIEGLASKLEAKTVATDSYHNILYALNVSGQIGDAVADDLEIVQKLFAVPAEQILKGSGQISADLLDRLEQREDIIDDINDEYASDYMRYIYYHLGWLHLALTGRETQYVEEFIRMHLHQPDELLPIIEIEGEPSDLALQACFKAHRNLRAISEVGSRFFYKRYRALLLARLQSASLFISPAQADSLTKEATALLQTWKGRERESDSLMYLSHLAPPNLRQLFPHSIAEHINPDLPLVQSLPTETDVRLWRHIAFGMKDEGAANTLYRLALLDQTDIYRPLPAEVLLELAHTLCRVRLAAGETIIWQGEPNDDVFILVKGELAVGLLQDGQFEPYATIAPGELFGEMAFFTQEARNATVRATQPAECFVLKDADLRLLAFRHPAILMQMAGVIARRLANFIRAKAEE